MNEKALTDSYLLFRGKGYKGSLDEYRNLIATNPNALDDSYALFSSAGYNKSIDDFKVLIGVSAPLKKKDGTESVSEDGSLVSQPKTDFTDFTSMMNSPLGKVFREDSEQSKANSEKMKEMGYKPGETLSKEDSFAMYKEFQSEAWGGSKEQQHLSELIGEEEGLQKSLEQQEEEEDSGFGGGITSVDTRNKETELREVQRELGENMALYGDIPQTTAGRKARRKKLMELYEVADQESIAPIANKLRELNAVIDRERGILNTIDVPTFQQVLDGAKPPEGISVSELIEMQAVAPTAAKSAYAKQIKATQNDQKKRAGYVEFGGQYYDPENLPPGFGFDAAMGSVDFKAIAGKEEEEVVPKLNQKFGQYGYRFEESGATDNMTVHFPNGKKKEYSLDIGGSEYDKIAWASRIIGDMEGVYRNLDLSEEEKIEQAMYAPSKLWEVGAGEEFDFEDSYTNNGYDKRRMAMISQEAQAFKEYETYLKSKDLEIESKKEEVALLEVAVRKNVTDQAIRTQYESAKQSLNTSINQYNTAMAGAYRSSVADSQMKEEMKRITGMRALTAMEWDISSLGEIFVGEFSRGAAGTASGFVDIAGDAGFYLVNKFMKGISGQDAWTDAELKEWKKTHKEPIKAAGELLTGMAVSGKTMGDFGQMIADGDISIDKDGKVKASGGLVGEETVAKFNESGGWITHGLTGMMRSLPAMMIPGAGRVVGFYAMGSEHLDEQMNKIPEFANKTEAEKLYLKVPLGLTIAVLEEVGMRNIIGNSSFVSKLVLKGIGKFSKKPIAQQTARNFKETIKKEIGNTVPKKILKGTILAGSSGAAEYETGYAQEVADIYYKEIYDAAEGVDYFDNVVDLQKGGKDWIDWEVHTQAHQAGLAEMVGGVVMGLPGAVTQAKEEFNFEELDEGTFEIFRQITQAENATDFLNIQKNDLESLVGLAPSPFTEGEMLSKEDVEFVMRSYEEVIALSETVKPEYAATYQKKIMNLALQRKGLQEEVERLDKATTKEQRRQIEIINEDIAALTKEAEQEVDESKREYDELKKTGKVTTDFKSWKSRHLLESRIAEAAQETSVEEDISKQEFPTEQEVSPTTPVQEEGREDMEKRAKKELRQQERQRRAAEKKEFKGEKIKGAKQEKYVPTQEEIDAKVEGYVQEQEAEVEAQLLEEQLKAKGREKFKSEAATEEAPATEEAVTPTEEATEQSVLDEEWNNEMQENKDAHLEAAEKQLKEEKGPGRRRMLVGRRQAPVVTEEEIVQRAKENLNKQNISLQEEEVPAEQTGRKITKEDIEEIKRKTEENSFIYKMDRSRTPSGKGRWEADFEIIDNRERQESDEDTDWIVSNRITGQMLNAQSKKDAQGIIKNAPAEAGIFGEGEQVDFTILDSRGQKRYKKEFERQKAERTTPDEGPQFKAKEEGRNEADIIFDKVPPKKVLQSILRSLQGRLKSKNLQFDDSVVDIFSDYVKGKEVNINAENYPAEIQDALEGDDMTYGEIANMLRIAGVYETNGAALKSISEIGKDAGVDMMRQVQEDTSGPQFKAKELLAPNGKPSNLTPQQYKLVRTPAFKKWFGDWENDPANASKVVDENGEPMSVYHGTIADFNIFSKEALGRKEMMSPEQAREGFFFTTDKKYAEQFAVPGGMEIDVDIIQDAQDKFNEKNNRLEQERKEMYEKFTQEKSSLLLSEIKNNEELKGFRKLLPMWSEIKGSADTFYNSVKESFEEKDKQLTDRHDKKRNAWEEEYRKFIKNERNAYINKEAIKRLGASPKVLEVFLNIREVYEEGIDLNEQGDILDEINTAKEQGQRGVFIKNLSEDGVGDIAVAFEPNQIKLADGSNVTFDEGTKDIRFRTKDEAKVQREQEFREAVEDETGDIDLDYIQATGRLQEEEEEFIDRGDEVFEIVEEMNKRESGNVGTNLDETAEGVTINTEEINERTDNKIPSITTLQIIDGIPTIFTISDQLTTGSVVNPETGNTIDNLRGGLGFTGTEGNENAAWANTTEKEVGAIYSRAVKTYEQNKELFHKWWKANPEFSGHIPMVVVKMGEGSILSNEATFRVLRDNLTKIPVKNKRNAVKFLRKSIKDKITTREKSIKTGLNEKGQKLKPLTIKNYQKEVKGHKETLKLLATLNPKTIDDVVSVEFIETLSLPARRALIEQITFGQPNRAGERKSPTSSKKKGVPTALIEGMPKDALELVHLGPITDLITEPQLKEVPQRSIIALQAVEIGSFNTETNKLAPNTLTDAVIETQHPNYSVGTKGKTIGILENPVSVVSAFPQAFANAMSGLTKEEKKGKVMTKEKHKRLTKKQKETAPKPGELDEASVGTILTEALGVQNGLPNEEFIGAIARQNITKEQQLIAFMNQSFPGVVISTDQETFDNVMNSEGVRKKVVDGNIYYGVTLDGDIYINPAVHNTQSEVFNTAIHEMGHVWQTYLNTTPKGRKIYKRGVQLVKQTAEYQRQLEIFDGNEDKAAHEAMAILIGNKGETIADSATQSKFQEWLLSMWKHIQSSFKMSKDVKVSELQDMNLDDFLGTALADIFSGKPVRGRDARSLTKLKNPEAAFSAEQDMSQVIIHGRNNGFSDAAIKIYLQRQGYLISEIKDALTINRDLFDNTFPPAFANVPGGVTEGSKMYERTLKKIKKYIRQNNPSLQQIQEQAQLFLKRDKTFKTYNDTLQKSLLIALNSSLEITESAEVASDIKQMRETIKQRRKGAKELTTLQTQLRVFLRKNFPRTQWESKEVTQLIGEITSAKFYKDFENLAVKPDNDIRMVMDKVSKIVMQKRVNDSIKKINKQLSIKTQKTESGRKKGVNFLPEAVERIQRIQKDLAIDPVDYPKIEKLQARLVKAIRENDTELENKIEADLGKLQATATAIEEKVESLRKDYEELAKKNEITDEDAARMQDIDTAILYNEALLMENDNPYKADTLVEVQGLLKNMLTLEREAYNEVIRQAKERYNRLKSEFLEDVSGVKVDYNDKDSVARGEREIIEKENQKDNKPLVAKFWEKYLIKGLPSSLMKKTETIEGLISRISIGFGEMFGGKSAELIVGRINDSRFEYYEGVDGMFSRLKEKAKEIFGPKFLKVSEDNQQRNVVIIMNQEKHNALLLQQKKTNSAAQKRRIQKEINKHRLWMSQNEMYYLYNQYKDPANHPGFATKWKKYDVAAIMKEITEKLDPKVKQWADWQVDELFPSVYQRYNEPYKKIYRTNMPWNKHYAGRLIRRGSPNDADMLSLDANQFRSVVGSDSTKVRIKNKKAIETVSGDNVLQQYIDEMEYFRAYGENMRDIAKMYTDELVEDAIVVTTDRRTYDILKRQLDKIINRSKARIGSESAVFMTTTSMFALSKLGVNPGVMLKQMTSSLAFADYIGYRNWTRYAGDELLFKRNGVGKWNKTWQEMYDNTAQLRARYDRDQFVEVLESYTPARAEDVLGGKSVLGVRKSNANEVRNFFMYLVKTGDMGGVMGSIPNYLYYKDQYKKKHPAATEQQLIDFAIRKVMPQIKSTQQSADIQDKDFFSTEGAMLRVFSLFTSSPRALLRKEAYAIRELNRKLMVLAKTMDPKAAAQSGKGSVKDNLRTFITYHMVIPSFFQWVGLGLPGLAQDWDDDDTEQMLWANLLGNINSLFVIGDLLIEAKNVIQEVPWAGRLRNIPLFQEFQDLFINVKRLRESEKEETKEKYRHKMWYNIFSLLGVPAKQGKTWIDNIFDVLQGDYKSPGDLFLKLLNYSKYKREGPKKKESKKKGGGSTKKKKTKKIGDKAF